MKEIEAEKDLSSIRQMMERSSKFISLSGLSGIMAGIYALAGFFIAYHIIYSDYQIFEYRDYYMVDNEIVLRLLSIALVVLAASLGSGLWLSFRQARKKGQAFFGPTAKSLALNLMFPLVTGGLFLLILISRGHYAIVPPGCLVFYGLALVASSNFTFGDVRWLGICEVIIGMLAALLPGYGILLWAIGFGLMHILYGVIMYYKYDR